MLLVPCGIDIPTTVRKRPQYIGSIEHVLQKHCIHLDKISIVCNVMTYTQKYNFWNPNFPTNCHENPSHKTLPREYFFRTVVRNTTQEQLMVEERQCQLGTLATTYNTAITINRNRLFDRKERILKIAIILQVSLGWQTNQSMTYVEAEQPQILQVKHFGKFRVRKALNQDFFPKCLKKPCPTDILFQVHSVFGSYRTLLFVNIQSSLYSHFAGYIFI